MLLSQYRFRFLIVPWLRINSISEDSLANTPHLDPILQFLYKLEDFWLKDVLWVIGKCRIKSFWWNLSTSKVTWREDRYAELNSLVYVYATNK